MNRRVSVLIPQYGHTGFTERAVSAVRRSLGDLDIEVLVHDNASAGGPGAVAERSDVSMSGSPENIGFGPAMNAMADRATGDYLLLLNNDTIVHPAAISRLVAASAASGGPVVPRYLDFDGQSLEMGGGLGEGGKAWQLFHHQPVPAGLAMTAHRADYGSAAAMMIPRKLFLEHGGFDDIYAPAYYEDTDLCLRLVTHGIPVVVEPRAIVLHHEGGTAGTDLSSGLKTFQVRNRSTFVARWTEHLEQYGPVGLHRSIIAATTPAPGMPRVLWCANGFPRGDRDGGGRRGMAMLTALREQGVGIAFHAANGTDPDRYGPQLAEIGIPWFGGNGPSRWTGGNIPATTYDKRNELLQAAPWDVVVMFSARFTRKHRDAVRTHAPGAAMVIDNGDLHFLRIDRGLALGGETAAGIEAGTDLTKDDELDAYESADGVITSSAPEDAVLRSEFNRIATTVFTVSPPEPIELEPAADGDLMFLGNFGHPPNADAVAWWRDDLAKRLEAKNGSPMSLRLVGAGTDGMPSDETLEVAGWAPDLKVEFARTRVFFAPLRYGAGTKGKLVEAMAHGLPVVTTSTGTEGFPPEVIAAMRVSDDPDVLVAHVHELMVDDDAWHAQRELTREAARRFHEEHASAGASLAAWLLGRADARAAGTSTARRAAPVKAADVTPAWHADHTVTDRPFTVGQLTAAKTTPSPIFVVGAPRSGTSMMAHALGQHPDLWVGEESDFIAPLGRAAHDAWTFGRKRGDLHWLSREGVSWEEFAAHLGSGLNRLYTDRSGGKRWVEQTPQYTRSLDLMADLFPGAKFVYMLRDGRSVAHSLAHFVRPVEHGAAAKLWAEFVRCATDFRASPRGAQLLVVDYTRVTTDTDEAMKEIFEFLELDHSPESTSFIADRDRINSSFNADEVRTTALWEAWGIEKRRTFNAAAGDLLIELGFESDASWASWEPQADGPAA